jgi:small-conductance mechanosensitive channel
MLKNTILLFLLILFTSAHGDVSNNTISTLVELKKSQDLLIKEIQNKTLLKNRSNLDDEKERLKLEIKVLDLQVNELKTKFEKIATGIDTSVIKSKESKQATTISDDFKLLLKPLIQGLKQSTEDMRKKAQLQEEIEYYKIILPQAAEAYENLEQLLKNPQTKELKKDLSKLMKYWQQQISLITSNLNASLHQVEMLEKNNLSFTESLHMNTKSFFQQRGLYLLESIAAFLVVIIVMNIIHAMFIAIFPALTKANRSFHIRFADLLYRILTTILAILAPMAVFYYEEDWVLFSAGLLILFGIAWTFRHLIPRLWQQARLLLNVGSVREEERIYYQNLPWRVKNINIFTILENPDSGVKLRLPIEDLVGLTSRPPLKYEPWFPCRLNDWVLLSNEYYGKVVGISLEFIELVDIGGGHRTFMISDFLSLSPQNLSTGFRIADSIGISYKHQKESTNKIVDTLEKYILRKIEEEGYKDGLKKLIVQFSHAGDSSLDIAVIANFNADMAPLYYRLKRAVGRWCVDACSEYGWEIPFPQLTVHGIKS